jgi:FkbM family methyltransferase
MEVNSKTFYQSLIRKIPFNKNLACNLIGMIANGKVNAIVNQANMKLDIKEGIQRQMFLGCYEPTQTNWFKTCVKNGDVFIDVGANFGYYTSLGASIVGEKGRVFAFEPSPVANIVIENMIADSNINNVVLIKSAVGDTNGAVDLYMPNTEYLHSPSIMQSDIDFTPIQISVVTLDNFEPFKGIDEIKLIKIDVEGYEPNVLDGMDNLIKEKRVKNIFCEFNSWWLERNSITSKQLLERFLDYRYKINLQTKLQEKIPGHKGIFFDLQDIWFTLRDM